MFKKTIEIYDGNFSSHYVSPFGFALHGIALLLFLSSPVAVYYNIGLPWLLSSLFLYFVGLL
jgi:hypothetical protein